MDEKEMMLKWVRTWQQAGPELEAIWRREVREADNLQALACLEDAFNYAATTFAPRSSSGMVEMQRLFSKLRK